VSEPINLNRRRKQRRRERGSKQADANRAWHGATRAERAQIAREREVRARRLDGLRRERPDPDGES
jgi:hypothetical protein